MSRGDASNETDTRPLTQDWLERVFPDALEEEMYQTPGPHTLHCDCRNALYHSRYQRRRSEAEVERLRAALLEVAGQAVLVNPSIAARVSPATGRAIEDVFTESLQAAADPQESS